MDISKIIESLSPNERKILPYIEEKSMVDICKKSNLDKISVLRALEYLSSKKIIDLSSEKSKIIDVGVNGALYRKKGLPERRLLNLLAEKRIVFFNNAKSEAKLSDDEFKASIGALKKKSMIDIKNGKIILNGEKAEIARKFPEEEFLESLPKQLGGISEKEKEIYKNLSSRKDLIYVKDEKTTDIKITELGKKIQKSGLKDSLIEQITPELLRKESNWKNKKFRRYDISYPVSNINGGKRHFVNQSIDYARNIWKDMGFSEMNGNMVLSSFWNFDSLFTAQDHPVREMQDTFFLNKKMELPDKKLVAAIKNAHEKGVEGSEGWKYEWQEDEAKKAVLRTHTTTISAKTLSEIKNTDKPLKYFAIGKCFRNETVDWSHGFEFNQTEGIVIDENANFRNLFGYLKEFFAKMGFPKIRMIPSYFPYTEPSVEIYAWHEGKKTWLEIGGAGILRPEVTIPLLGKNIPVLAWGPGFDRILMDYYEIKDLRDLYKNDLNKLRKMKFWMRT